LSRRSLGALGSAAGENQDLADVALIRPLLP
jgi:hypothetical protein